MNRFHKINNFYVLNSLAVIVKSKFKKNYSSALRIKEFKLKKIEMKVLINQNKKSVFIILHLIIVSVSFII